MRKREKRFYYVALFCAIAMALFSLESTMQLESNDSIIEEINHPTTRRGRTDETPQASLIQERLLNERQSHSPEEFISIPSQDTTNTNPPYIEEKIEEKKDETVTSQSVEKIASQDNTQAKEKKEEPKEETEFSSIQSSGLTLANGDSWYFEEYDKNGNIVSTASYNKKKLISKSQFEYDENGKKLSATLTEPKRIIKLTFDDKGMEIGRTEYKKRKGQIGDIYSSHQKIYNEEGILQEETTIENAITTRKIYTYNDKKLATETIFENGVKILFVEYQESIKIVHIFDREVELSVFEEVMWWKATGFFLY